MIGGKGSAGTTSSIGRGSGVVGGGSGFVGGGSGVVVGSGSVVVGSGSVVVGSGSVVVGSGSVVVGSGSCRRWIRVCRRWIRVCRRWIRVCRRWIRGLSSLDPGLSSLDPGLSSLDPVHQHSTALQVPQPLLHPAAEPEHLGSLNIVWIPSVPRSAITSGPAVGTMVFIRAGFPRSKSIALSKPPSPAIIGFSKVAGSLRFCEDLWK